MVERKLINYLDIEKLANPTKKNFGKPKISMLCRTGHAPNA